MMWCNQIVISPLQAAECILYNQCSGCDAVNTLRPRQNGRHFADDTFKYIFLNENIIISAKISLQFVPKGPIDNIPALVQIMAWHQPGNKPLSEPMMVRLPTHICVTQPQWVNSGVVWLNVFIDCLTQVWARDIFCQPAQLHKYF